MAFGNAITDGVQVSIGQYGYIVSFDLSANLIKQMIQLQMQNTVGPVLSVVSSEDVGNNALNGYPSDVSCPDFAFAQDGSTVKIFCKTATYPYTAASRVAMWLYRSWIDLATLAATSDVKADKERIYGLIVLREMYLGLGKRVPVEIQNGIGSERESLGI